MDVSVIKGGLLDILIDVFDVGGNKMFSRMFFEGKGGHEIKFITERPGDYQVCFNNEMARWTAKVVAFKVSQGKLGEGGQVSLSLSFLSLFSLVSFICCCMHACSLI